MDAMNVFEKRGTDDYDSSSEVFAYASKLVEDDLAAAVRIFRNRVKNPNVAVEAAEALA